MIKEQKELTIEFMIKEQTNHGIHDRETENKRTMESMIKEQIGHGIHDQRTLPNSEQR